MSNQLNITNFVNVSVSQTSPGLGNYNTSNLGLFTDEAPNLSSFGALGYASYLSPTQVGVDFGTSSVTYQMANAIFSQQPNILNGGGQLVVALMTNQIVHAAFSGTPASGAFLFTYGGNSTASIAWNDSVSTIQTKLRAVSGLSEVIVTGSLATSLNIQMAGIYAPTAVTTGSNTLQTAGSASITITITTPTANETLGAAITRTQGLVQYFGIVCNESADTVGQTDMLAAAAIVQALTKLIFFVSNQSASVLPAGLLDLLRSGSDTQSRGLYYGDTTTPLNAVLYSAAYAGRALSVNFSGSNTTLTMNLQTLQGVQPDPTITQTILTNAIAAGADTYASYQGVSAVNCAGTNQFYDAVYNQLWLQGALQVASFNYLQGAQTKIPQTEQGMDGLKGAVRIVMEQAVTNQYLAPGTWTSPVTFGNSAQLLLNVAQRGYYLYSVPISQQSVADRTARKAPLIEIAAKAAGAIQSANIIVQVNS